MARVELERRSEQRRLYSDGRPRLQRLFDTSVQANATQIAKEIY